MHYLALEQTTAADLAVKTGLYQNQQTETCLHQNKQKPVYPSRNYF